MDCKCVVLSVMYKHKYNEQFDTFNDCIIIGILLDLNLVKYERRNIDCKHLIMQN